MCCAFFSPIQTERRGERDLSRESRELFTLVLHGVYGRRTRGGFDARFFFRLNFCSLIGLSLFQLVIVKALGGAKFYYNSRVFFLLFARWLSFTDSPIGRSVRPSVTLLLFRETRGLDFSSRPDSRTHYARQTFTSSFLS